jgi:hypothetical protein
VYRSVIAIFTCVALGGCSDDPESREAPTVPFTNERDLRVAAARCVVSSHTPIGTSPVPHPLGRPWLTRGPDGPRAYVYDPSTHQLRWSDAQHKGEILDAVGIHENLLAWAGHRFVAVFHDDGVPRGTSHDRVVSLDANYGDPRPLRTNVSSDACNVDVTELGERVLLSWRRCNRGRPSNRLYTQVINADATVVTNPREYSFDGIGEDFTIANTRWDFAHAVVDLQMSGSSETRTFVFVPEMARAQTAQYGSVACPRSGCLSIVPEGTNVTDVARPLRLSSLSGGDMFRISAAVSTTQILAVSDDRLLILHGSETRSGCDLTVIDTTERLVIAEHHDDGLECKSATVLATPRGFALVSIETNVDTAWFTIDCTR